MYIILGILFYFATAFTGIVFIESWKNDEIKLSVVCFVFSIIFAVSTVFCFAKFTEEKVREEIVKENLNQGGIKMKATELMLGDWVSALGKNCRITSIDKYDAKVCTDPEDELFFLDDIYPIPLTYEILKKNGWKKHATYGNAEDETLEEIYMLYQHSFEVVFDNKEAISIRHFVSEEDDGYDKLLIEYRDNGYKPMYVHTLQHALRLCGLDELADNFKV